MKVHSRNNSNKSVEHYVLTTKKIEHHTNRCSSESQLKLGSGLLDFRTTQPKMQLVAETGKLLVLWITSTCNSVQEKL